MVPTSKVEWLCWTRTRTDVLEASSYAQGFRAEAADSTATFATVTNASLRGQVLCPSGRMDIALPEDPRIQADENQGTSTDCSPIYAPEESRDPREKRHPMTYLSLHFGMGSLALT